MANSIDHSELFDDMQHLGKTGDEMLYIRGVHVQSWPAGFYHISHKSQTGGSGQSQEHLYVWSIVNNKNVNIIICYSFCAIDNIITNVVTKIHYGNNNTIIFKTNDTELSHLFYHVTGDSFGFGLKSKALFGGMTYTNSGQVTCFDSSSCYYTSRELIDAPLCLIIHHQKISEEKLAEKCNQINLGIKLQELINFDERIFKNSGHRFMHINFFVGTLPVKPTMPTVPTVPTESGTFQLNPLLDTINLPRMLDRSDYAVYAVHGIQFVDIPIEII